MSPTFHFLILILLLVLSSFFSATETSLFSLSKIEKKKLKDKYPAYSKWIFEHLQQPRRTLGTILIGNLFVNTLASALVTLLVLEMLGNHYLGMLMFLFVVVLIIFCEMIPKALAVGSKIKVALLVAIPLEIFAILLTPFRKLMRFVSDRVLSFLIHEKMDHSDMISEKELKVLVKIGEEEGVLGRQERYMIQKLLDLGERPVKDIMTPRIDLIGLDVEDAPAKHEALIKKCQFNQLPVFQGSLDHVLGVVESQRYLLQEPRVDIQKVMRPPLFIPDSKRIDDLLETFRQANENFAICVDEYGGTAGVVTQEDILEEIFGEFYDEYAQVEHPIRRLTENSFMVEGKVALAEFNEFFTARLVADDANTLGGYLLEKMGVVPIKGFHFETEDFEFVVQSMIRQRIHQVVVRRKHV